MLLHRFAASMSLGVAGSVTQPCAPTGSATASQSFAPSPGTDPWYLDSDAFFHMTPHSTHLSALCPSYHHCTVHIIDGFPLSVAGQGMLCSNSFHVSDVFSLI
jgi:hypothetical protein